MSSVDNAQKHSGMIIVSLVVGLVLAGLGMWFVQPDSPPTFSTLTCDNEVMSPGDKCIVTGGGKSFTYESEMAERSNTLATWRDEPGDEVIGWLLIGVGLLGAVGGTVVGVRRGRRVGIDVWSVPAVPPQVRALAAEHGLGDRARTHRTERGELWLAGGGTAFFGIVTIALAVGPAHSGGWTAILVIGSGLAGIYCLMALVRRLMVAGSELYLFDHGLVHSSAGSLTVFPWRDTQIRRSVIQQQNASKPDFRYWLDRPGTATVQFRPGLGLDEFGPDMEQRLTVDRAPADFTAIANGRRIEYGPFAVDVNGLSTPKGTLPWAKVRAVELKQGSVQVWEVDVRRTQSVEVDRVPNVFVLLAMVQTLQKAAHRA